MTQKDTAPPKQIHESISALALRIILLQFIVGLASILINAALFALIGLTITTTPLLVGLGISNIILQTIDAAILIYLIMMWANTSYILTPEEIIVQRAGMGAETKRYETANIESIEVQQSFLGRLLNYGTLKFYDPTLGKHIYLPNVPRPYRYSDVIKPHNPGTPPPWMLQKRPEQDLAENVEKLKNKLTGEDAHKERSRDTEEDEEP